MRIRLYNARLRYFLDKWPGKRYLGMYRFLPMFFVLGAALEFSMINWHVGEVNFCKYIQAKIGCLFLLWVLCKKCEWVSEIERVSESLRE